MIGLVVCLLVAGVATAVSSFVGGGQSEVGSVSSLREVATDPGERATIRMTDGTQVTLNVDSRLRIADESDSARRVFLEGEAYFDVASGERPFIVHVKEAMVNVHGTAFDVKSYPEERQVQVAVAEGVVSLHPDQQTSTGTRLTKGQLGHISGKGSLVATEKVDVKKYLGWTEDQIVFEDASLLVVARRLARWYGMSFEINDPSIETLRLTARLNSASMRDVMDVVSTTLGICYEVREDRVLLKQAGNCPESNAPGKKTLGSGSPEA
jgi:ferric-dicitrate binding protein FerR (iron transport regulator)